MLPSDVERTALERVPGTGAVTVERLASGLVNESYLVVRGGARHSLRVPSSATAVLGVDREWECRVLAVAAAHGIAPRIECCDPLQGILVTRWAHGRNWTVAEAALESNLEKMAVLAHRVHALPVPAAPRVLRPRDWIEYYRAALGRRGASRARARDGALDLGAEAERRLERLGALPTAPLVLCHSDLHVHNLLECDQGLMLLDWEYAHVSEASWDLAAWSCNNDLSEASGGALLRCYLGREPGEQDRLRLAQLEWLYDYVCLLWIELYLCSRGAADGVGLATRAAFLARRLEHFPAEFGGRAG